MSGYRGRSPIARTKWLAVFLISCPFLLTACNATNGHIFKSWGPGINSSQSKNVGKIQLSKQLSHLSITNGHIFKLRLNQIHARNLPYHKFLLSSDKKGFQLDIWTASSQITFRNWNWPEYTVKSFLLIPLESEKKILFMFFFNLAFLSHSKIFPSYGDVIIAGEGLQILTYAGHSWPLSSEGSLACHTYCDKRHPFMMVISKYPWHSYLLPSVY